MPTRQEIVAALYGAARLARFDARGMQHFDVSIDGFWKSFFALVLVLPFGIYSLVQNYPATEAGVVWVIFVEAAYYVIDWLSFPLIMIPIARWMRLSQQYVPFIIASNWSTVIQSAIFFVLSVIAHTGILPIEALQLISLVVLVYAFMYQVFVARVGFGVGAAFAILLALFDFALSYLLLTQSERFL